jgi:hypothetical protein
VIDYGSGSGIHAAAAPAGFGTVFFSFFYSLIR